MKSISVVALFSVKPPAQDSQAEGASQEAWGADSLGVWEAGSREAAVARSGSLTSISLVWKSSATCCVLLIRQSAAVMLTSPVLMSCQII